MILQKTTALTGSSENKLTFSTDGPKTQPVRILHLEDNFNDHELMKYELQKAGLNFEIEHVVNEEDFENALKEHYPDIILSDYNLPVYHGLDAFYTAHKILPDTPFIMVSGSIGEVRAVDLIKGGVTDYVLKEKLYSLLPKIQRALLEARERKQNRVA